MPQRNAQALGIEPALLQIVNVVVELAEVHLLRLQILFFEVVRRGPDLRKRSLEESAVIPDIRALDVAHPAILKNPSGRVATPNYPLGKDAPG